MDGTDHAKTRYKPHVTMLKPDTSPSQPQLLCDHAKTRYKPLFLALVSNDVAPSTSTFPQLSRKSHPAAPPSQIMPKKAIHFATVAE